MEQQGLTVADMKPYIGPPDRVRDVLDRKRSLSLGMIRRLHRGLRIPAEIQIGRKEKVISGAWQGRVFEFRAAVSA